MQNTVNLARPVYATTRPAQVNLECGMYVFSDAHLSVYSVHLPCSLHSRSRYPNGILSVASCEHYESTEKYERREMSERFGKMSRNVNLRLQNVPWTDAAGNQ